jgi:hypothetical protein
MKVYSIFVDISSRNGSQVGIGLVLSYVPYVDEVPFLEGGLLVHLDSISLSQPRLYVL